MWKRVIRDYIAAFRWERIKESQKVGNWWLYSYMAFVLPLSLQIFKEDQTTIKYFSVIIPILFCTFVIAIYPMVLPKIMYLCPMSKPARRRYLEQSRILRIAVVAGMSLISIIIMAMHGVSEWFYMISVFTNHVLFAVCMASTVNKNGYGTLDVNGKRVVDWDSKTGIFEGCMMVITLVTAYVQACVDWSEASLVGGLLLLIIPTAVELPMVIWLSKRWPDNVERALCFETANTSCKERE